jgi:polyphosphate glucokinase
MRRARTLIADWAFDAVSIGYPGAVGPEGPVEEAGNLGPGWVGFDFEAALRRPVRVVNDAALQALGNYDGGRMLFLGLGTGLGSALVAERVVIRLELGSLHHRTSGTIADRLGADGLADAGQAAWRATTLNVVAMLGKALSADYVVLGGGNASKVAPLPEGIRLGAADAAFIGGVRLWQQQVEHHDGPPSSTWRILR